MRRRFLHVFLFFISLLFITVGCRKEEMDSYYNRPDWLAQPIYQQLQSGELGKFSLYLQLIDKAGYNHVLDRAGYYTAFVPTDSAFQAFLDENYSGSINNIDSSAAQKMVSYLLVYNAFNKDRLEDYQSSTNGWVPDLAFKRRTVYYKGVYRDPSIVTRYNTEYLRDMNQSPAINDGLNESDNGNKYIPFFTQNYFIKMGLSATDYNYFYPETPFTGFNVASAKVLKGDIIAENGYIHVINKMFSPLQNMDEYLTTHRDKYGRFKEILDSFIYKYVTNNNLSLKYEKLTGIKDTIFVKKVDKDPSATLLGPAFGPNNENWYNSTTATQETNITQTDGWTLFAPENDILNDFIKNKLCKYYGSFGRLPNQVMYDFINTFMSGKTVWPSKFASVNNALGEKMSDVIGNITDKKFLSNGVFYGINTIHKSNVFYTVFGDVYLNPRYSIMSNLLVSGGVKESLIAGYTKYTIFMIPDEVFIAAGYRFDPLTSTWQWLVNNIWTSSSDAYNSMLRIAKMHIVQTDNNELNDLSGEGMVKSFGDDYIKFKNNVIYSAGNIDTTGNVRTPVSVLTVDANPSNGKVYETNRLLRIPSYSIRSYIGGNPNYSSFYALLKKTTLFSGATSLDVLLGNGQNTIFIPTNQAIAADPINSETDISAIERFIKYHIVPKKGFIGDNNEGGTVGTFLTIGIEPNKLVVSNQQGNFTVTDEKGNTATIVNDFTKSYTLGNKTIIHQIDKVLKYLSK